MKICRATPSLTVHTTPLCVRKEPPAARTRCPSCSIVLTAPRGKHLSSTTQRLVCRIQSSAPQHLIAVWRPPLPSPSALPEACKSHGRRPRRPLLLRLGRRSARPARRPLFQPGSPSCPSRPARGRWPRRQRGSCGARARRGSVARRGGRSGRRPQRRRCGAPNALESMCGHDLEWSPQSSAGSTRLRSAPLGSARLRSAPLGSARLRSAPLGSARLTPCLPVEPPVLVLDHMKYTQRSTTATTLHLHRRAAIAAARDAARRLRCPPRAQRVESESRATPPAASAPAPAAAAAAAAAEKGANFEIARDSPEMAPRRSPGAGASHLSIQGPVPPRSRAAGPRAQLCRQRA